MNYLFCILFYFIKVTINDEENKFKYTTNTEKGEYWLKTFPVL